MFVTTVPVVAGEEPLPLSTKKKKEQEMDVQIENRGAVASG